MSVSKKKRIWVGRMIKIILPLCFLLAGVEGWNYFGDKAPEMKRKPSKNEAALVQTVSFEPGNYQSSVHAMGTVMPDREITLKSKVSGEIVFISDKFVQGGLLKKGEILLTIDESDYKIEVSKARSALDKALSDLAIEEGSQMIAKEELKLINQGSQGKLKATDLAMRKPQLVQAKAAVESARADLDKALLDQSRTKIVVPFNALILEKQVHLGSLVTDQGTLATLVDVDDYRIEAQVPPDRLAFINIGEKNGSRAVIRSQYSNQTWHGKVVRMTGKVSDESQMAGVIILVSNPLGLNSKDNMPRLLLYDHVNVQIMGQTFENVFSLPRTMLRDDNTVWLYNSGFLDIKNVRLAWKEDGRVFIKSGISPGDFVIASDLAVPIQGMVLRLSQGGRS